MSVTKRKKSPFYQYDFTFGGRRYRGTLETTSRKEAEQLYSKIRSDLFAEHKLGKKQDILLRNVFNKYYTEHASSQAWAATVDGFLKKMATIWGLDAPLASITDREVGQLVTELKKRSLKPASINRHLEAFRKLYRLSRDIWGYNVAPINFALHMQKEPDGRVRYLTYDESELLIENAAPHLRPVIRFALYTGVRLGNILDLKWREVDMASRRILFKVKSKLPGGKNHTVYMADDLFDMLKGMDKSAPHVFTYDGQPLNSVKRSFKTACRNAGITDFHFHDLRHTHASWLVQNNTPLSVVQDMLGHADPKTTRRYAHHVKEQYIQALENTFNKKAAHD